ncbi:MAG: VWA domain-containing protein [Granulosicoccus sp.]
MKIQLCVLMACSLLLSACGDSSDSSVLAGAGSPVRGPVGGEALPGEGAASVPGVGSDVSSDSDTLSDGAPAAEAAPSGVATSPVEPSLPQPEPPVSIQPGTLTAGDYDDQLNPSLYERYSDNFLQNVRAQTNIPRLDLSQRIAVIIKDSSGNPFAGANIAILDTQGETTGTLMTPANGITYLYEDLDGLAAEFTLRISDRLGDVSIMQTVSLDSIGQQRQLDFVLDTPGVANNQLDLQLVIDTTASMGDELSYLQAELSSILNSVRNANPQVSIRTGLVVYRDVGDQYVVRSYPFTDNLADMQSALNAETFDGGGDYPEAMDQALAEALTFDWREQSARVSLLVADAPPHSDRVNATWASALAARSRQIHIVPLAASGVAEDAEYLMRSMAALTNSRYLFLTDDSGVGNPHDEPEINCYIVTRLDSLIRRVINQLVTGVRTEPSSNEVIREVGDYDNGVCRTVGQQ